MHETFLLDEHIYIFEDLICGGDLFSYLIQGNCLKSIPENEVILIVYQLLKAIDFLHNRLGVIHRDLKLDNVLLMAPVPCTKIVLCDFGIAKSLKFLNQRTKTVVGTVEYSAPEIFSGRETAANCTQTSLNNWPGSAGYDYKCDTWSLGIMIHIMLSGISPFYNNGQEVNMVKSAKMGKLNFERSQWNGISSHAISFVKSLIQVDPNRRLSIRECSEHDWISRHKNQLEQIYETKIVNQ